MATKNQNVTLKKNDGKKFLQPFCENAAAAAFWKSKAEELRPQASAELKAKLDKDPETKDFTGTVVYLCDDKIYKIRVQRRSSCDWRKKQLKDEPNLEEYKALMNEIDEKKELASKLEEQLAKDHPKCLEHSFVIAFLSK